jgi:cardiolipin synthase A/B
MPRLAGAFFCTVAGVNDSEPTHCTLDDHQARWLADGDSAYAAMAALIEAAQHSIALESYLVRVPVRAEAAHQDPAAQLLAALLRARGRGVHVQVLYDAFGSEGLPVDFFAPLIAAGGEVRVFSAARRLRLSCRDHRKLLVCDVRRAIVGGMNIAPEYAGDGVTRGWRDLALQIEGPVVAALAASFAAMYALAPVSARAIREYRRAVRALPPTGGPVSLLTSGPGWPHGRLRGALRADLRRARAVHCMAAYFLPPAGIRRALRRVRRRGGSVTLLLGALSDVPVARYAAEHLYARILAGGARLYEYQPQVLHAKLLVIDDTVYIGSCNLDRRSLNINYELLLRLEWPQLAAQAGALFAASLAHSRAVPAAQWRMRRRWWERWRSRVAYWLLTRVDPLLARRPLRPLT